MAKNQQMTARLRVWGLIRKEGYQIIRDPSSIMIAFVLPMILLFVFSFAVSLDSNNIKFGIVLESETKDSVELLQSFENSGYFDLTVARHRKPLEEMLEASEIRGFLVIPEDFEKNNKIRDVISNLQLITDGGQPNTASIIENYVRGAWQNWLIQANQSENFDISPPIETEFRTWYNPASISRNFLLPGSIAIIMTLIGSLLTSLVIAREWERGTMEALLATPISIVELLFGKLFPYYILGLGSLSFCLFIAIEVLGVPFRGSYVVLYLISSLFLLAALSLGLLVSTLTRNQFLASQVSINTAFLPAFLLSGFIFEITSTPTAIQFITYLFPARYYVTCLKTLFLTGNVYHLLIPNSLGILAFFSVMMFFVMRATRKRLD